MRGLRIVVADDHELLRRGVRSLIEAEAGWTVVGEARDGLEACQKVKELKPDVVILDIGMPRLNGLDAARRIKKVQPDAQILMLTIYDTEELAHAVLEAGARGYVTKADTGRELVRAIEALVKNRTFFTSRVDQMMLDSFLHGESIPRARGGLGTQLSSREREVVQLIAEGKTNKEVATTLELSVKTIETHRARIMKKLACHTARDLILYAVRNKLVQV